MFLLEALIVIGVLIAIGYPLMKAPKDAVEGVVEGDEYHKLLYAKEAAYIALKDLEFDYKTAKLDDDDYRNLKTQFEAEAVEIFKKLEAFNGAEADAKASKVKPGQCPSCGKKVSNSDSFCRGCGKEIQKS